MDYRIFPPQEMPFDDTPTVDLPLSKSIFNRLLVINAAAGNSVPAELGDMCADMADDMSVMAGILSKPLPTDGSVTDVKAAGTVMRFVTAMCAATEGVHTVLDGVERMRQRPIASLVDALRLLGADIEYKGEEGFPPLEIRGRKLTGGEINIDGSLSSQYPSAILMVAPMMAKPLTLTVTGETTSEAYLKMTAAVMRSAGVEVDRELNVYTVAPGNYKMSAETFSQVIERDWSAASYFYETAALWGCGFEIAGLREKSIQGDSAAAAIFHKLGVDSEFNAEGVEAVPSPETFSHLDLDMSDTPDLVPAVAVAACMLRVPFRMSGVKNLRIKECDRIGALISELDKLGCIVTTEHYDEVLVWEGKGHPVFEMPEIDTHGDHRIAMAFAPVSLYVPGIVIKDAEVVSKSFPDFWKQMASLGFMIADAAQPLEGTETDFDAGAPEISPDKPLV